MELKKSTIKTYTSACKSIISLLEEEGSKHKTPLEELSQNTFRASRKLPEIMCRYGVIGSEGSKYTYKMSWDEAESIVVDKILPEYFKSVVNIKKKNG